MNDHYLKVDLEPAIVSLPGQSILEALAQGRVDSDPVLICCAYPESDIELEI